MRLRVRSSNQKRRARQRALEDERLARSPNLKRRLDEPTTTILSSRGSSNDRFSSEPIGRSVRGGSGSGGARECFGSADHFVDAGESRISLSYVHDLVARVQCRSEGFWQGRRTRGSDQGRLACEVAFELFERCVVIKEANIYDCLILR